MIRLRDYTATSSKWITTFHSEFYPESIDFAIPIYQPVINKFGEMLDHVSTSAELLHHISSQPTEIRTQLLRIFRKYVSPDTSVEMLKRKSRINSIIDAFGHNFRDIGTVRSRFMSRPIPDEGLVALLNEYRTRGEKGYALSGRFFQWFQNTHGQDFHIDGPTGAGKDINLSSYLDGYPRNQRPVDMLITSKINNEPLVVGLIRYDSDRGGAQEDDRTSGYSNVASEVLSYADRVSNPKLKLLFINDGPGLLLGSMWADYCNLEDQGSGRIMVATLKMLPERLTAGWIRSAI